MKTGSAKRRSRETETHSYLKMVRRMIRGAAARVAAGDVDDLEQLVNLRLELELAAAAAVAGLRDQGYTWQAIGTAVGTTGQAANMRWRPREDQLVDQVAASRPASTAIGSRGSTVLSSAQ